MNTITTRTAEFSNIEGRVFLCKMIKDSEVDVADSEENFHAIMKMADGKPYSVLVDARVPTSVTKEGLENASQPRSYQFLIAQAIVVNSLANRIVGNFIIKFYKPSSPTKLFSDYDQALAWLRELTQKDKEGSKKVSVLI